MRERVGSRVTLPFVFYIEVDGMFGSLPWEFAGKTGKFEAKNMGKKENRQNGKKKKLGGHILFIAVFAVIGAGIGFMVAAYADQMVSTDAGIGEYIFMAALLLVGLYVSMYLQFVIHEAGHLVCGLLSGYHFSSFRVGSIIWLKDGETGKIVRKKMSIAGTGGQCLMSPPDLVDGRMPVTLYNLGGVLANVLSVVVFVFLGKATEGIPVVSVLCKLMVVFGLVTAITNGIPLRLNGMDNDGRNVLFMRREPEAIRSLWVQLKASEQVARGVRLKDMPSEWFYMPDAGSMKNSMVAVMGVFYCNRLIDEQRFDEAKEQMERLLKQKNGINGLHRGLMICDLVYCKLVRGDSVQIIDGWMNDQQKQFMKSMKTFPSVLRTEYAYALLREKDEDKAAKILEQFDQVAKTYPYPSDIESERELLMLAAQCNVGEEEPAE